MPHEFEPVWRGSHARPNDTLYLVSTTQRLGTLVLPNASWRVERPVRYNDQGWYDGWVQAIVVPPDASPGDYKISWHCPAPAADFETTVKVLAAAPDEAKPYTIGPDYSAANLNTLINHHGARRIRFLPGTYTWETNLYCGDPAAEVYFEGEPGLVVFRRKRGAEYGQRMIALDDKFGTIHCRGISFRGLGFETLIYHGFPGAVRRLDIIDCDLQDCQLMQYPAIDDGPNLSSVLVRRVTFKDGSGTGVIPAGTTFDWCKIESSTQAYQHAFFNGYGVDRVLCMNTDWRGTNRGVVSQGSGGQGCLYVACFFRDIAKGQTNGSEVLLWEPSAGNACYNAVVGCHVFESTGPGVAFFGKGISHNRFDDVTLGCRGQSIYINTLGLDGPANEENVFNNVECDGDVLIMGNAPRNQFNAVICRSMPVSCGNQHASNGQGGSPQFYRTTPYPFVDQSQSQDNQFNGCSVSVPDGLLDVSREPPAEPGGPWGPIKVEEVPAKGF